MALLDQMSAGLLLPAPLIRGIARKASYAYKEYEIPKRAGGHRTIHHPSKALKALQRWLVHNVVSAWPVHEAAYAYRAGISIRDNAARHAASNYLLRLDLLGFFPSITEIDVDHFLQKDLDPQRDWPAEDRELFALVVCRFGRLTIGAPTSPALSNAICFELDSRLTALAEELGATYTRYADDLFFSTTPKDVLGQVPGRVADVLQALECPSALELREDKTRHSSKKGRRQVTGLVLGSDGQVHLGRSRKRFIRRQIYRWHDLGDRERRELAGLVAFAMGIDADFINSLILKYGSEAIDAVRSVL